MNRASKEFNKQLELDVMISGLSEVTDEYVCKFNWQKLDEVVIPIGVKSIGDMVFGSCSGLTSIIIPDSVTSIGSWAFQSCSGLTSITIPASVTKIDLYAFYDCDKLSSVTFEGKALDEVKAMRYYPWGIENPEKVINSQDI